MRVAFLSPCWPHDRIPNGIASYVSAIRNGLNTLGVETRIFTSDLYGSACDPDVSILSSSDGMPIGARLVHRAATSLSWHLGVRQISGYRVGVALQQMDQQSPLDLFEIEESFGVGAVVQRYFKKPVVVRLHGPWCVVGPKLGHQRDLEFWIRCAVEYRAIQRATAVSSPSQDALDHVRRFYRLSLPDARVIPNPVPFVSDSEAWIQDNCEPKSILFVGRFDRVKGADTLLQAFTRVASSDPDLRLVFVGPDAGMIHGGRTIGFEAYSKENVPSSIRRKISFLGTQTKEQVAEHRKKSALTVVSSRYENFPMVVLEAMACGSPLVASRTGGIKEIVRDDRNGLLFDAESSDGLADQIERLLGDRGLAARLGAAARADVAERYGEPRVAEQTRAFYEELIGS